jgi:predicted transcriptional regulator
MMLTTITPVQERLLFSLAQTPASASELADSMKTSLPYVLSQLKLLEAQGVLVRKTNKKERSPGKPRQEYSLANPIVNTTVLRPGFAKKSDYQNDSAMQIFLQLYSQMPPDYKETISEYFWSKASEFILVKGLGKINISSTKVELVALTAKKHLDQLRKTISTHIIHTAKQNINLACWVHTKEEFIEGIKNNDSYYVNLAKKIEILIDDAGEMQTIKELLV